MDSHPRGHGPAALWRWLLLFVVVAWPLVAQAKEKEKVSNFERLKDTRGARNGARKTAAATAGGNPLLNGLHDNIEDLKSRFKLGTKDPMDNAQQLAFFRSVLKDGLDPFDAMTSLVNSKSFNAVLEHTEMQHRILEQFPLLAAFDGFKQVTGRRLGAEETKAGFAAGVKNMLSFFKEALVKLKDPANTGQAIVKLSQSGDPHVQELFSKARAGDKDAVSKIGDMVNLELFPTVDPSVVRRVAAKLKPTKLLNMPEVMRFIDEDPFASAYMRNPIDTSSFLRQDEL